MWSRFLVMPCRQAALPNTVLAGKWKMSNAFVLKLLGNYEWSINWKHNEKNQVLLFTSINFFLKKFSEYFLSLWIIFPFSLLIWISVDRRKYRRNTFASFKFYQNVLIRRRTWFDWKSSEFYWIKRSYLLFLPHVKPRDQF